MDERIGVVALQHIGHGLAAGAPPAGDLAVACTTPHLTLGQIPVQFVGPGVGSPGGRGGWGFSMVLQSRPMEDF